MEKLCRHHQPLFRHVLVAEWFLLAVALVMSTLLLPFRSGHSVGDIILSLTCLVILAPLSLQFPDRPTDGPLGRTVLVLVNLFLVSTAFYLGANVYTMPLYLIVLAKVCLLFKGSSRLLLLLTCITTEAFINCLKANILGIVGAPINSPPALLNVLISSFIINISPIALSCLASAMMIAFINEQQLRAETVRLAGENEKLAAEVERNRIAREMHDSLGNTLTSLKIQLELARRLEGVDELRARQALDTVQQLAVRSLADVRIALHSIRDPDFDFNQAVEQLVGEVKSSGKLAIVADLELSDMPKSTGFQLFRIIQECVTNTLKHANAASMEIHATTRDGTIFLKVRDDGRGMEAAAHSDGLGLKGMKERVENLRGRLNITGSSDGGTEVAVELPLRSK